MFQTSQWIQALPGASGSSAIRTRLFAALGKLSMRNGGFMFEPSQVYLAGIFPPSRNALFVTFSVNRDCSTSSPFSFAGIHARR